VSSHAEPLPARCLPLTEAKSTLGSNCGRITALAGPADHHAPGFLGQGEVLMATVQRLPAAVP